MIKKIKMMLYGQPGVGKSVFALKFPKPFFITTDGNYEWLDEFGAKEEDHKQVSSWDEFLKWMKDNKFENYDTIVIDLIEDLFKWCENEFCRKNKLEHIGDLGYGKGYRITRDEFFIEMTKLLALDKNVIFLSHESSQSVKDKRGVENVIYGPSKTLPELLRDQLEGRLRYVLRAKFKDIIDGEKIIQERKLSLGKDSNEFSIIRGVNMDSLRDEIELDYLAFVKELKLDDGKKVDKKETKPVQVEKKEESKKEIVGEIQTPQVEVKENKTSEVKKEEVEVNKTPQKEEVKENKINEDIIATIKAKLEAMKGKK